MMACGALCDVYMNLHICMLHDCLQNVIAVVSVKLGGVTVAPRVMSSSPGKLPQVKWKPCEEFQAL